MLTKEAVDAIHDDLWHGHANVEFSRDKRTEARTVDALCRTALALYEEVGKLREIAKHAGAHARGDEDGGKLSELLDATRDPELMFSR